MKYISRKNIHHGKNLFLNISVLVIVSLIIRLKCLPAIFFDGPTEAYKLFQFNKNISKFCAVWYFFKIKWTKSELHISVGSFCAHVPLPLKSVCGTPDDLSDVNTNFETSETLQTIHYLSFYRFLLGLK